MFDILGIGELIITPALLELLLQRADFFLQVSRSGIRLLCGQGRTEVSVNAAAIGARIHSGEHGFSIRPDPDADIKRRSFWGLFQRFVAAARRR